MKRIVFVMAAMLCLFGSVATAQPVKQKVAVYVTGDADAGYKKVIGSKMVSGITRSDNYVAIERTADFLAELAKEQDYQMSGAVSDNQIVRLGQQFGVRYVLVADISEVFETMFVSARMIDVQTGQIKASAEGNLISESLDGLTELSDTIVSALTMDVGAIKIIGPFMTEKDLYYYDSQIPQGYKIASGRELGNIMKAFKMLGKKLTYPIYADIARSYENYWYHVYGKVFKKAGDLQDFRYGFYYDFSSNDRIEGGYIYLVRE